jgi:hypothetical protein
MSLKSSDRMRLCTLKEKTNQNFSDKGIAIKRLLNWISYANFRSLYNFKIVMYDIIGDDLPNEPNFCTIENFLSLVKSKWKK